MLKAYRLDMAPWQFPQRSGSASRKATDSGESRSCPGWHEVQVGFCRVVPPGAGRLGLPAQTAPAVDAGPQPIFDSLTWHLPQVSATWVT